MRKRASLMIVWFVVLLTGVSTVCAEEPATFQYISPVPGSSLVSAGTTIAVRHGEMMDTDSVSDLLFDVTGSQSGIHNGHALLAADGQTVIFVPDQPFAPGETVYVSIQTGLRTALGEVLPGLSFEFRISPKVLAEPVDNSISLELSSLEEQEPISYNGADAPAVSIPHYETAPADLPDVTMTTPDGAGEGYLFLSPSAGGSTTHPYLLILQDSGDLIYYQELANWGLDFKKQPNGLLTYIEITPRTFKALDSTYSVTDTFSAGNGYSADIHDLQLFADNDHALLLIYDSQTMDMSEYGGPTDATVIGLVVQELDADKNVVFQWRSWDHFAITDTVALLNTQTVDYVHGNAVERDTDGNLMISSRNLNEITKINRQTGAVIWRWGGKRNQFTFTNNDPFYFQHDIRRLSSGNVTIFDNGSGQLRAYSRVVEFELDEVNKVATSVWEYRDSPDTFSMAMGSAQRLSNGNTFIGWGSSSDPGVIEAKPDGTKAFELKWPTGMRNYRAFRFPWEGSPSWAPTLLFKREDISSTLYCSWNGATDIADYRIYAGETSETVTTLLGTKSKTGFETSYDVTDSLDDFCFYRVMPVDTGAQTTQYSNIVFPEDAVCGSMPSPVISSTVPITIMIGTPGFTLTVEGEHFYDDSQVRWNDSPRPTTYVSATQLLAQISAEDVELPGTVQISVFNPAPRGGSSNSIGFDKSGWILYFPIMGKDYEW